jgi:hypothetical protein
MPISTLHSWQHHLATNWTKQRTHTTFNSQLCINIECAFGRFVHQWSVLHAAIPKNITIAKTISMVCAMARLHNFCIDQNESVLLTMAPDGAINLELAGIVLMEQCDSVATPLPLGIMHGGEHFMDYNPTGDLRRMQ